MRPSILRGQYAGVASKHASEIRAVVKADRKGDLGYGHLPLLQAVAGGDDAVAKEILSEGDAVDGVEAAAELEPTQPAMGRDETGRKLFVVVVANKIGGVEDPGVRGRQRGGSPFYLFGRG